LRKGRKAKRKTRKRKGKKGIERQCLNKRKGKEREKRKTKETVLQKLIGSLTK